MSLDVIGRRVMFGITSHFAYTGPLIDPYVVDQEFSGELEIDEIDRLPIVGHS